jgi:predicted GNAT family N-acyltransferase
MFEQRLSPKRGFREIAFSQKVSRCVDRPPAPGQSFVAVNWSKCQPLLEIARREVTLASDSIIQAIMAKNPDVMRATVGGINAEPTGLFIYLPLNAVGTDRLVRGTFDGLAPHPEWITGPGETPEAIYLWFVYMPGKLGRMMTQIASAFDELVPGSCTVFSKAVTVESGRLQKQMGFMQASAFYPECAEDLLVVFPEKDIAPVAKPVLGVTMARSVEDIFKVFSVRSATYIAEQFCLYSEEFDGNDFCATHFLGTIDGDAAGCIRIRFFDGFAKIERLAVRAEYRNSRLAFKLVRAAIEHCRMKGYRRIYGHSRLDLVKFWSIFGFRPMAGRDSFAFANVKYVEILWDHDSHPDAITLNAPPMVVIRPEGAWDRPGPLDISKCETDPRRKHLLASRTRTVNRERISA